jgi:phospholipid/cholesterol/gamma-HCH transport system permease protein
MRIGLAKVGHPLAQAGAGTYELLQFCGTAARGLPSALLAPGIIMDRFYSLIVRAWPLVAITSFATGAALALQFGQGMARFGGKLYVPNVVAIAIVRALGPVFACLMVAARSGGGIASEIGSMKVTQQIDALRALGADPVHKLITPTIVALALGMPVLTFVADVAGIVGGLLASAGSLGIVPELYLQKTVDSIRVVDLGVGLVKTALFGVMIAVIASFVGMRTKTGTSGIGIATTAAIVAANIFVLLADLVVTKLLLVVRL